MRPLLAALAVAFLVALPAAAVAAPLGTPPRPEVGAGVVVVQERMFGRIFGGGKREELERQASEDALRIQGLEEEVRRLTGQVETLTYTVRRLEGALAATGAADPRLGDPRLGDPRLGDPRLADPRLGDPRLGGPGGADPRLAGAAGPGAPPAPLGSTPPSGDLARGGNAAATGGGFSGPAGAPIDLSALDLGTLPDPQPQQPARPAGPRNAALDEVRELHDSGRYAMAAERARQVLAQRPSGAVASEARYMLGEALLAQRDFRGAANSFLENYTADPQGARAPMSLVRLGTALNGLGEKTAACSSLDELFGAYPDLDPTVRAEAVREREAANCA